MSQVNGFNISVKLNCTLPAGLPAKGKCPGLPETIDPDKARVMPQQQIARIKGFRPGVRPVTRNEKPLGDLIVEEPDRTEARELAAELWICPFGALRKNKPNALVPWRFLMVAEHTYDVVVEVDGKTGKHSAHLGI